MKETTIIEAIEDPNLFGPLFNDQGTWKTWKIALKAIFGIKMNAKELRIFRKYTGRKQWPRNQFSEVFALVGRRGGKSYIAAVIACYLALFYDWSPFLAPGEAGWVMVIAADRPQARVILNYIKGVLKLKIFRDMVEKELTWEVRLRNQIIISVKTCDYRTIRGFTVVAAVCDELAFWRSEGANPAEEILTALRPAMATIPGSLLLGISTPYAKTGALYEAFRDKYGRDDPDVLIWKASTKDMNPVISKRIIDKALKDDYSSAKAEWLAEFREDLETFLPSEMIEEAVIPNRWQLPKLEGVRYNAFTDPSGGRRDSFTLAVAHKDNQTNKVILDCLGEHRPPFRPEAVVEEFCGILKRYEILRVTGDKYSGEWVSNAFRRHGVTFLPSSLTKSGLYLEFLPQMAQGGVELLDNKRLVNQLRSLERRSRSGGKDSIDHPPGGRDDLANAVAGAVYLTARRRELRKGRVLWP